MKKTLFSFIMVLGSISLAQAQINEVGISLGGANYVGNIGSTTFIAPKDLGYSVFYRWNKSPRHSYRLSYANMSISGNDAKSDMGSRKKRGLEFKNTIQEFTAGLEFNFFEFDLHQKQAAMTPYLFAGLSMIRYNDLYFRGKRLVEGDKKKYSAAIPVAVGLKLRLTEQINVNAEVSAHYTFTKNLDGSQPTDEKYKHYAFGKTMSDWYFYSSIGISYTFGKNPCYCAD